MGRNYCQVLCYIYPLIWFSLIFSTVLGCIAIAIYNKNEIGYPYHLWYWCIIEASLMLVSIINILVKWLFPIIVVKINDDDSKSIKCRKYIQKHILDLSESSGYNSISSQSRYDYMGFHYLFKTWP